MSSELTHTDAAGRARMVDIGGKDVTRRTAVARGEVRMRRATLAAIIEGAMPKGDVLAVARVAGIMAAKRTDAMIPLCHSLPLEGVRVDFRPRAADASPGDNPEETVLEIQAEVSVTARTGAEMEALTAVSVAALTVYDMCKAIDRAMEIGRVRLVSKGGGRSGEYRREGEAAWTQ